jgi:hypothetical protein
MHGTMNARTMLAVLLVSATLACSGGSAPRPEKAPQPEPAADLEVIPCGEDDGGVECFERRRDTCREGVAAWRFDLAMLGEPFATVHVSELGLLRLDHRSRRMFGTGGELWLSCMDGCDGGAAACFPYRMPTTLGFAMDETCERQTVAGEPWHGRDSRVLRVTCSDGAGEVRYVPSLEPIRAALGAAGMIDESDALAALEGLPVSMELDGEPLFSIGALAEVGCPVFDYPEGHAVFGAPADFDELQRVLPMLDLQFQERAKARVNQMLEQMFDEVAPQLLEQIGTMCIGERAAYDADEVEDCLAERPELREPAQALVSDATAPLLEVAGRRIKLAYDLVEEVFDVPLCRHFTAADPDP